MEHLNLAFLRSPAVSAVMISATRVLVANGTILRPRSQRTLKGIAVLSCAYCVMLFGGIQLHAVEKAAWTASPSAIYQQKGVYPPTVTVRLFWNGCVPGDNGIPKSNQLGQYYSLSVTGSGVTASTPTIDDCSLTTTLTIGASAAPGLQAINVTLLTSQDAKSGTGKGFAELALMDATAGPTPNGPEVDVLWEVLTDNLCKDNFGNRMPSQLFCVDVKVGNNTGHNLQLAGLGFTRKSPDCVGPEKDDLTKVVRHNCTGTPGEEISIPNVGYQIARASEQYGSQITTRNIISNTIQGLGLLMASFTPFFENTSSKSKWSTGAAIVGTSINQAINLVAPDLTVRELQNLDDQAFRDGKLIPNNTQVRLLVFVQKKSLAEAIGEIVPQIKAANDKACPPAMDGYKPDPEKPGYCYPIWEDSFKNCLKKLACNPMIVRLALGRMVIIGDKIDYIQRVVVDSNVTSQEVPAGGGAQPAKEQQTQMAFTSPSAATVDVGKAATPFTIKVTGKPAPSLSADSVPSGMTFVDNKDGTATLSGTPAAGTAGKHGITVTAHNGAGTDVTQTLTLTINP